MYARCGRRVLMAALHCTMAALPYDDAAYGGAVLWRHCTMAAAYYGGVIMVAPQYDGTVMMALHCGGAAL